MFTDAEYTSNVAGNMGPSSLAVMPLPTTPGWQLANVQSILPGAVDEYILTVEAEVDLDMGDMVGDNMFNACGSGANPNGSPGEGLYNEVFLDSNVDGMVDDSADVCLGCVSCFCLRFTTCCSRACVSASSRGRSKKPNLTHLAGLFNNARRQNV